MQGEGRAVSTGVHFTGGDLWRWPQLTAVPNRCCSCHIQPHPFLTRVGPHLVPAGLTAVYCSSEQVLPHASQSSSATIKLHLVRDRWPYFPAGQNRRCFCHMHPHSWLALVGPRLALKIGHSSERVDLLPHACTAVFDRIQATFRPR